MRRITSTLVATLACVWCLGAGLPALAQEEPMGPSPVGWA